MNVTCVLNGFRRPQNFRKQIEALQNQTVKPKSILYWQNTDSMVSYDQHSTNLCMSAISNHNFGVWSRFAYALNARTEYVCIFDDDTIPGTQWLENCLETYKTHPGLLGTIGVIFPNDVYHNVYRVGWDNPNETTQKVDIVGHAWFFHRDLLSVFWRELPDLNQSMLVGEDIHFSAMIQKYTNLETWVPPHPKNNREMWGSLYGWELGADAEATANYAMPLMRETLKKYIDKGFKIING